MCVLEVKKNVPSGTFQARSHLTDNVNEKEGGRGGWMRLRARGLRSRRTQAWGLSLRSTNRVYGHNIVMFNIVCIVHSFIEEYFGMIFTKVESLQNINVKSFM